MNRPDHFVRRQHGLRHALDGAAIGAEALERKGVVHHPHLLTRHKADGAMVKSSARNVADKRSASTGLALSTQPSTALQRGDPAGNRRAHDLRALGRGFGLALLEVVEPGAELRHSVGAVGRSCSTRARLNHVCVMRRCLMRPVPAGAPVQHPRGSESRCPSRDPAERRRRR